MTFVEKYKSIKDGVSIQQIIKRIKLAYAELKLADFKFKKDLWKS
jgi:hypothetical protein